MRTITVAGLRRVLLHAQGYASRLRRAGPDEVAAAISRLACVQLDSISAVERSHRIVLSSRVGVYPPGTIDRLLSSGRVFEYWAHEACLLPVEEWPLFAARMRGGGRRWYGDVHEEHPGLADRIVAEITERGPLGSRHFEGAGGGMWEWKPAKRMLERLWNHGDLVVAGRQGFQRLYDLPERVIPRHILERAVPEERERLERLAALAVTARGALTEAGVVEHWRLRGGRARFRPALDRLTGSGALEWVEVDDGGPPVLVPPGTDLEPDKPTAAVLLSPFDNLLWDRPFARRVLGFDHLIEVYKPAPERRYGYYVLPLLWRDRIVGRADLKSDRAAGVLRVRAFHRETGVRASGALDEAFDRALDRLRRVIGLAGVESGR